jgi:hypothetical protein
MEDNEEGISYAEYETIALRSEKETTISKSSEQEVEAEYWRLVQSRNKIDDLKVEYAADL